VTKIYDVGGDIPHRTTMPKKTIVTSCLRSGSVYENACDVLKKAITTHVSKEYRMITLISVIKIALGLISISMNFGPIRELQLQQFNFNYLNTRTVIGLLENVIPKFRLSYRFIIVTCNIYYVLLDFVQILKIHTPWGIVYFLFPL